MGILRRLLTLPVSGPLNGTVWLAGKIHETAETELNDPATLRRSLRDLEQKLLSGEISEEEYDAAETVLLKRMRATT